MWISWEQKELFGWNKKSFSVTFMGHHLLKKKVKIKNSEDKRFKIKAFNSSSSTSLYKRNRL